ncbi:hypothetical protein E6O75_ATG11439 [Venturia nashicola]|uniref:PH domain-containing protein n=1 Tax=Venturia nashicola TaxID=86259 RepID=A0A4Z1NPS6_9PEZI|nr:hypothetical protein E6O75_ATG11439 [Venturia nashicola]
MLSPRNHMALGTIVAIHHNAFSSFLSQWSHHPQSPSPSSPIHATPPNEANVKVAPTKPDDSASQQTFVDTPTSPSANLRDFSNQTSPSPNSAQRARAASGSSRPSSRPASMVQTFQPPLMEVATDTPPELQPIFTFLNSHSNKLYQEGYFLKLHDLDGRGRPSTNRTWQECFAQLVGTVLSLWDAAELDSAGEDGEVTPTFINLADASIKMLETLPMNEKEGATLQNVLSISTAANNRYLLHFNSLNALTQWTAGIRLAMYEHATLQEAYTGSLIAGKGKQLNNIRQVMERSKFKHEDWARVRFGAGTSWRRCWFVITPPDEKGFQKMQKKSAKKNMYDKNPVLKGTLKFYETCKVTKKTTPIATISNAYSAYAIYPQSKPLIDQSTLVKVEGKITIHSKQESVTEGLVFVMPETHPAVSGFEMLLRFLFPVWDTFALYGRPNRLIADVIDQRGLMFAMPKDRRYGYLEILDVAGLIHGANSNGWGEREWRKNMKELTSKRMLAISDGGMETLGHRKSTSRTSLPARNRSNTLRFDDAPIGRSTPQGYSTPTRTGTSPADLRHRRSASEVHGFRDKFVRDIPSALSQRSQAYGDESPPPRPPPHGQAAGDNGARGTTLDSSSDHSADVPSPDRQVPPELKAMAARSPPPGPVGAPPGFAHTPSQKPRTKPNQAHDLRRGQSDLDQATLSQMAEATQGRSNQAGAVQGQSRPVDQYSCPPINGYQAAYDDGYRSNDNYQQSGLLSPKSRDQSRGHTPLATIPASPFIEQASPILDRAEEQQVFQSQNGQMMAQNAALNMAIPMGQGQNGGGISPGELSRKLSRETPGLDGAGSSFSHRKPVGGSAHTQEGHPQQRSESSQGLRKDLAPNQMLPPNQPWPNAQPPNPYSQQQQGPPQVYNGYPSQQQQGPAYGTGGADPRRGQSPYRQPDYPLQQQELLPNGSQQMPIPGGLPPQQWSNAQPPMQQEEPPYQPRPQGQGQQWI